RLLLLQAPIVGVFLVLGFVNQDYRKPMPILRELTDEEREALIVVRALNEQQKAEAEQTRPPPKIIVRVAGVPVSEEDKAAVLAPRLTRQSVGEADKKLLEQTEITVEEAGEEQARMKATQMLALWRELQDSSTPDQLLRSDGSVIPDRVGTNPRYTYVLLFVT